MSGQIATLRAGAAALLPIYPTSFDDVVRFARMSIMAGMIKPQKIGWGDQQTTEDADAVQARATMIILQGMELGLPPMQSVQLLAMINGRITAHSEAVPGLLWSKGFKIKSWWSGERMTDAWTAHCSITRPEGDVIERTFSVVDAKQAGLWSPEAKVNKKGKGGSTYQADNDSPWFRYPQRMLPARALGFAGKDGAADALKGLMVREEIEDMLRVRGDNARDVTPLHAAKPAPPIADLPDIPDEAPKADETAEAKAAIESSISLEMLAHVREAFSEVDWDQLEPIFDAKMVLLEAEAA